MDKIFLILAYCGGIIVMGYIAFGLWYFLHGKKAKEDSRRIVSEIKHCVLESIKETELLRSDEMPSDEDILLYYKMYCKKFELDTRDTWTTLKPMSFDEWDKRAKNVDNRYVINKWQFMIPRTSDAMVGMPPNATFQRYRDYKAMVKAEDDSFLTSLEEEADEVQS